MRVELEGSLNIFMLSYLIRAFLFSTLLLNEGARVDCFFFKISNPKPTAYWDTMKYSRRLHKPACECGVYDINATSTSWNVYVHTTHPVSKSVVTCTGTIINSNTVVTSHKCLLLGKKLRIVDLLKFKHGTKSIARAEHVLVTRTSTIEAATAVGDNFTVVDIWYNTNYAISSETRKFPENDMVLIKVSENFINQKFAPICLPYYDKKLDREGGFDLELEGYFYVYRFLKTRSLRVIEVHPDVTNGYTLSQEVCYGELQKRMMVLRNYDDEDRNVFYKTICFDFIYDVAQENQGGPLVLTTAVSENKAFLLGISTDFAKDSSQTGTAGSLGREVAFFSSIFPLIKYIEHFSQKGKGRKGQESTWCRIPKFNLKKGKRKPLAIQQSSNWPWDDLEGLDLVRDESLDCLCGIPNTHDKGRIAGGVEATPREFGWMVQMYLYNERHTNLCGGSIINDRVILTAAHCVVVDAWIFSEKVSLDPDKVSVTLNVHNRKDDPLGEQHEVSAVLFHPDYLLTRQQGNRYFDKDIALLILKNRLTFPSHPPGVRPICLPEPGNYTTVVGENATVAGWGLLDPLDRESASNTLQKIVVPIANLSLCTDIGIGAVTDNFLCAGTLDKYHDAAGGDSGGPLMIQDPETQQWTQVGIVSYGESTGAETAALYSDVQKLLPFVDYHSKRVGAKWCRSNQIQ